MTKRAATTNALILRLLIFLLPTQFGYHLWTKNSYIFGIRVDYLAPAVYFTDLLVCFFILLVFLKYKKNFTGFLNNHKTLFLLTFVVAILNTMYSVDLYTTLFSWLKYLKLVFFGISIYLSKIDLQKDMLTPLTYSLLTFTGLSFLQLYGGKTIGGIFYLLGERTFSIYTPGISTINFFGNEILRGYSTFSHPNSMAGFFGLSIILLLGSRSLVQNKHKFFMAINIAGLFATFSLWAIFILFILLSYWYFANNFENKKVPYLIFLVAVTGSFLLMIASRNSMVTSQLSSSLSERIELLKVSGGAVAANPLTGTGLGNFVRVLQTFKVDNNIAWRLQPVHNVFALLFSETGTVGVLLFSLLLLKILANIDITKTQYILGIAFVLLTGVADHYWLTLQQNNLLAVLLIGLMVKKNASKISTWTISRKHII